MNDYYIPRCCHENKNDGQREEQPKLWREAELELLNAYVLLAEPGMGKTSLFKEQAKNHGGEYLSVREFLRRVKGSPDKYLGETLFLDGLDEARAGADDRHVIDDVCVELEKIKQGNNDSLRFRLSCRSAVWHAHSDRKVLCDIDQDIKVFSLEPLDEEQIKELLEEKCKTKEKCKTSEQLIKQLKLKNGRLSDILKNPLLLELLAETWSGGNMPENHSEIYNMAIDKMLFEVNGEHAELSGASVKSIVSDECLKTVAGQMFTVMLVTGKEGFIDENCERDSFVKISDLPNNGAAYLQLLNSKLFAVRTESNLKIYEPYHRSIAEFLGGKYLAEQVNDKTLSAERASVFCGSRNSGVASDLRGLHGWLTTHTTERAALLKKDPAGLMMFGDLSILKVDELELLINELAEHRHARIKHRGKYNCFWRLEMKNIFSDILRAKKYDDIQREKVYIVLNALEDGESILDLHQELLAIIQNEEQDWYVRITAIECFYKHREPLSSTVIKAITNYLDSVVAMERISGVEKVIVNRFLVVLYPHHITPGDLAKYYLGDCHMLSFEVNRDIFSNMNAQTAGEFWDGLVMVSSDKLKYAAAHKLYSTGEYSTLLGQVLAKTVATDKVNVEEFFQRFQKGIELHLFHGELKKDLIKIMENLPELFPQLSHLVLDNEYQNIGPLLSIWHHYLRPFIKDNENKIIWESLSQATAEKRKKLMSFWFNCHHNKHRAKKEILGFIKEDVELMEIFRLLREDRISNRAEVNKYKREERERQQENKEREIEQEKKHQEGLAMLRNDIDALRRGERHDWLSNLEFLIKHEREDNEARKIIITDDIEKAFYEGCKAVVCMDERLPTVDKIIQAEQKNEHYRALNACIIGMEEIHKENPELLLALSDKQLLRVVVAAFLGNAIDYPWLDFIVKNKCNIIIEALLCLISKAKKKEIINLGGWVNSEWGKKYSVYFNNNTLLQLLSKFPFRSPQYRLLTAIARIALRRNNQELNNSLKELTKRKLATKSITPQQHACWLALALCLDMEILAAAKDRVKDENCREIFARLFIIDITGQSLSDFSKSLSLPQQKALIQIFGPHVKSSFDPFGGSRWVSPDMNIGDFIQILIEYIGSENSNEATTVLSYLISIKELEHWRVNIRFALGENKAIVRDAAFSYLSVKEAVDFLIKKQPHNVRDLRELLIEELTTLEEKYRNGETNGWRKFWAGTEPHDKPREENFCRDRLVEDLRGKFSSHYSNSPEAASAGQRRVDLLLSHNAIGLPVEMKRAHNRNNKNNLWKGIGEQLADYTKHPNAEGCGLYLVFWFGDAYPTPVPPQGESKPRSLQALRDTLNIYAQRERNADIKTFVLDVSPR